jgi:hypothetical protein
MKKLFLALKEWCEIYLVPLLVVAFLVSIFYSYISWGIKLFGAK